MVMMNENTYLPPGPFTRDDLIWDSPNTYYFQAARFLDFLLGETIRIYPRTVFLVDEAAPRSARSVSENLRYSEIKSYRCAYGPEDDLHIPSEKKGQAITKLGCQCGFEYRTLRINPDLVCIHFVEQGHVTIDGRQSHGTSDDRFLNIHQYATKISDEIKSWVFSRLVARLNPAQILAEHRENVLSRMQEEGIKYRTCKDDFLKRSDIQNVVSAVRKGTWRDRAQENRLVLERARPILGQSVARLWPARTRCEVLQDTNPNTISGRQVGAEKETVDLTSSSELEAEEVPSSQAAVDQFPRVTRKPTTVGPSLREMEQIRECRESMRECMKYQTDQNKMKRQPRSARMDPFPEVTSQPANVGASLREMEQRLQSSHGYYPDMLNYINEALKAYQTDHNKRKRQPSAA